MLYVAIHEIYIRASAIVAMNTENEKSLGMLSITIKSIPISANRLVFILF
jgi:hypothetical protein